MAALTTTHRNKVLGSLHRHPRRVTKRGGLLAVLISIMALVLMPQPAFGHASSVGSSPAADAVLDTAPSEVRIDFDSGLLEMGAALIVRSAEGSSVTTGPAVVGDRTFSVPVDPAAAPGVFEVGYRIVSADGHTIEGSFAYTVAGGASTTEPVAAEESTESSSLPIVWIILGGVILILALGAALLWRR